jgi:hypothetical protein
MHRPKTAPASPHKRATFVKTNEHGGVLVTDRDVEVTVNALDKHHRGAVTASTLKSTMDAVPALREHTAADWRSILPAQQPLTTASLKTALVENSVSFFDPVEESFRSMLREGEHSLDVVHLRRILRDFFSTGSTSGGHSHSSSSGSGAFSSLSGSKRGSSATPSSRAKGSGSGSGSGSGAHRHSAALDDDAVPSEEDMMILLEIADQDKDGRIGLSDWRALVAYTASRTPVAEDFGDKFGR